MSSVHERQSFGLSNASNSSINFERRGFGFGVSQLWDRPVLSPVQRPPRRRTQGRFVQLLLLILLGTSKNPSRQVRANLTR